MLEARELTKVFPNGEKALDHVSFRVAPGRVLTLLGPSGCGKSTILRIVAGLEEATSGSVHLDGEPLDGVPPGARDVGFVFQNYALYPHLTVARNFSLALEARRLPRDEIASRVAETARLLGLEGLLDRRPASSRRAAAARRARAGAGAAAARLSDGRAALESRRPPPRGDAPRAEGPLRPRGEDGRLRHPRPERGDEPFRRSDRPRRGTRPAGRAAA